MSDMRKALCFVLVIAMSSAGCTQVETHSRPTESELADLKVAVYWRDMGGDRHFVGGLRIELTAADPAQPAFHMVLSDATAPTRFLNLRPGTYRLRIVEGDTEHVDRSIRLDAGRLRSVRVNVTGQKIAEDVGEGTVKAVVIVGTVALLVGIAYLSMETDWEPREREEAPTFQFNFD